METIAAHNSTRWDGLTRKADYIIGITIDGAFYCADCVSHHPSEDYPGPYGPHPVFSSDEYRDMVCDKCLEAVS